MILEKVLKNSGTTMVKKNNLKNPRRNPKKSLKYPCSMVVKNSFYSPKKSQKNIP